jgi:perosamine synthetase
MSVTPGLGRPRIRLARPDVGEDEIDAIRRVFLSGILTNGDETAAFEEEFANHHGAEHGVAFANGTVALAAAFLAHGIGPGDEVIVPSFTFISTATSVLHVGARPVFADIDPETFNLDPADVTRHLTPATRAIVPVHYAGQAADLDELGAIAADAGAAMIEDAAEAHGATYRGRPVGAIGSVGMFSFTPTKNITTGEGGILVTHDGALAERLRLLRNHGQTAIYEHSVLGYNWRITEMQAAMGRVQLAKLPTLLERKRAAAFHVEQRLALVDGICAPIVRADRDHVYMLYTTTIDVAAARDGLMAHLREVGVEAKLYFPPAHRQPVFATNGAAPDLPVTEWAAAYALSLPLHTRLTVDDLEEICDLVEGFFAARG